MPCPRCHLPGVRSVNACPVCSPVTPQELIIDNKCDRCERHGGYDLIYCEDTDEFLCHKCYKKHLKED